MEAYPGYSQPYPYEMPVKKPVLPQSVAALVLGIVSLATMAWFGWIPAIIALNNARKAISIAQMHPGRYSEGSLRMAIAGRTMGTLGLIFGLLGIVVWVLYFLFIFVVLSHAHRIYT